MTSPVTTSGVSCAASRRPSSVPSRPLPSNSSTTPNRSMLMLGRIARMATLLQPCRQPTFRLFLFFFFLDRAAGLPPGGEAAADMGDRLKAHPLHGLRRQRGAPAAGAVEQELLAGGEHVTVVGAFGSDPDFQHADRAMDRPGDNAVARQPANVRAVGET